MLFQLQEPCCIELDWETNLRDEEDKIWKEIIMEYCNVSRAYYSRINLDMPKVNGIISLMVDY
jgi:hypothetical protein